jgi:hypothetical protein
MSDKDNKTWSNEIEQILISWSEKALCYRWLHQKAQSNYQKYHHYYIIPIIILSTVTGTANFGLNSFVPPGYETIASMSIGGLNLFTGLLTTLLNFFRYAELKQSHENAVNLWHKYHRAISTEIALEPTKRQEPNKFFSWCKVEYEKIIENSPMIPENVVKQFRKRYKAVIKQRIINLPEVIVPIEHARLYQEYMRDYQKTLKRLQEESMSGKKKRLDEEINANIDSSRSSSPTTDESNTSSPSIQQNMSTNASLSDIEKKFEKIMNETL